MTSTITTLDILRGTRELLATPERWTQGVTARDADGQPIPPNCEGAVSFCLVGGVRKTCGLFGVYKWRYVLAIEETLGITSLGSWNDEPERTHAEILSALDQTIEGLESEAIS